MKAPSIGNRSRPFLLVLGAIILAACPDRTSGAEAGKCTRTIVADVVALDQPYLWNRLGASQPAGMVYALKGDVVPIGGGKSLEPGGVMLRGGKRPRPLVLRMNVGDCLRINFTNLLARTPINGSAVTRYAGIHVNGLELVPADAATAGTASDGSFVGRNPSSLAAPGESKVYQLYAKEEGTFLLFSAADNVDDQGNQGNPVATQASLGLFGAVNVQPEWAEWYRSQVTRSDLEQATIRSPADSSGPGEQRLSVPRMMSVIPQSQPSAPGTPRAYALSASLSRQLQPGTQPRLYTLRTYVPDKHKATETDVLAINGRLYTKLLQPLIDYHALYPPTQPNTPGKPVLSMLQAASDRILFTTQPTARTSPAAPAFSEQDVQEAVRAFNSANSLVTSALRKQFQDLGTVNLSDSVRITGESGHSWLLTDPGRAVYLVTERDGPSRLEVAVASLHLVYSDLTAMITGPNAGRFGYEQDGPSFFANPILPDRRQPYREFTIIYHFAGFGSVQAFSHFSSANLSGPLGAGDDQFAINYGSAAIGSEILANRLGVGPMGNPDAVDLKYEEFFLSSWAVGDPGDGRRRAGERAEPGGRHHGLGDAGRAAAPVHPRRGRQHHDRRARHEQRRLPAGAPGMERRVQGPRSDPVGPGDRHDEHARGAFRRGQPRVQEHSRTVDDPRSVQPE